MNGERCCLFILLQLYTFVAVLCRVVSPRKLYVCIVVTVDIGSGDVVATSRIDEQIDTPAKFPYIRVLFSLFFCLCWKPGEVSAFRIVHPV